ncbi:MAG: hypothetical protein ACYCZB_16920 [Acidiphilium sp.]
MSQAVVDRERVANRVRPRIGRRALAAAGLLALFAAAACCGPAFPPPSPSIRNER